MDIIDEATATAADKMLPACKGKINAFLLLLFDSYFDCVFSLDVALILSKEYKEAYTTCEKMSDYIINEAEKKLGRSINPYDIKLKCPVPGCFNISNVGVSLSLFLLSLVLLSV